MHSISMNSRGSIAKVLVLGLALTPMAMIGQTSAPTDPSAATQDQQGPPQHGGHMDPSERDAHMLKMMTKQLDLTPDQVTQVQGIQADSRTQMQSLRSDTSVAGPDKRAKMMEIHKTQTEKIRAVLNDQQRTKFDAMEQHRRDRMDERRGEDGPPPAAQQ